MAKAYSYDFRQKVIESIELDGYHDKTQAEMAELWDGPISARTISRALAKIGFTRKKTTVTANAMKRNGNHSASCSATPKPRT